MREGKWEKKKYQGIEISGKTLGIIGMGRIGRELAIRAKALGVKVLYTRRRGPSEEYNEFEYCTMEELLAALNSGKLSGAGIDVYEEEPTKNIELISHPKVSATPHIGAYSIEAQERIGEEIVTIIKGFFK